MNLDIARIQSIITDRHSYYGSGAIPIRKDTRWYPAVSDYLLRQLTSTSRVLDIGCGDGEMLFELSPHIGSGVGVDNDPDHLDLAHAALRVNGATNLAFHLLDYPRAVADWPAESFDLVYSMRGPLGDDDESTQAAMRLLRPGGLLFCDQIGEGHHAEVRAIFEPATQPNTAVPEAQRLTATLRRNGVDVRLVEDAYTKWIYPDVYAWLQFQCNIWTWLGRALPQPDDPRLAQFAERYAAADGSVATTHHVARVAGIKPA